MLVLFARRFSFVSVFSFFLSLSLLLRDAFFFCLYLPLISAPFDNQSAAGIVRDRLGSPGIVQDRLGSPRIVQDRLGSSRTVQDRPELSRIVWGRPESS